MKELQRLYSNAVQSGRGARPIGSNANLPAGCYVAEIDAWNPFVEPGIDNATPYKTTTWIVGFFE